MWCQGTVRARANAVIDGDLFVGALDGILFVNDLTTTQSLETRQDATFQGPVHAVGTTTFGSSPNVGRASNVVPPGLPTTPEIAGVTQFLDGNLGVYSTLKGYYDERRKTQLNNDKPVLLGVANQTTGELLLEGGPEQPLFGILSNRGSALPLKGAYNQVSFCPVTSASSLTVHRLITLSISCSYQHLIE